MVYLAINLGALTFIFFVLGMYKPQWPLFFMKAPTRFNIAIVTTILIMISVTLFGEGHRRNEEAKQLLKPVSESPVPVPVPESEIPKAPASK